MMSHRKSLAFFLLAVACVSLLIQCGGNNGNPFSDSRLSKAGKLGIHDIEIKKDVASKQETPKVAFDSVNNRYLIVWKDDRNGNSDIYGKWIYVKYAGGTYSFGSPAISIAKVYCYDSSENEITPTSLTALPSTSVTISVPGSTTIVFVSDDFQITSDAANQINPAVAFGSDGTNNNFFVVWEDYRDVSGNPKIMGKTFDKNCGTSAEKYAAGSSGAFYTYSSTIYRLYADKLSQGQIEPDVAFDSNSEQFMIAWVDMNDVELNYRYSPRKSVAPTPIPAVWFENISSTTSYQLFESSTIPDNKIISYRYFNINGDMTGKVNLYSDANVESTSISTDAPAPPNKIFVTMNGSTYVGEALPKITIEGDGSYLIAFKGKKNDFTYDFTYFAGGSSPGGGSGPYCITGWPDPPGTPDVLLSSSSEVINRVHVRKIKTTKDNEKKLFSSQIDFAASFGSTVDSHSITVATPSVTGKFMVAWAQTESVRTIKGCIIDSVNPPYKGTEFYVANNSNDNFHPVITMAPNGKLMVAYEENDTVSSNYIKGQFINSGGSLDLTAFKISNSYASSQYFPAIVSGDSLNRFFTVFEDNRNQVGDKDIYGNFYSRIEPLTKPAIFTNVSTLNFGNVFTGYSSVLSYSITNEGTATLSVTAVSASAPFTALNTSATISPSASSTLRVKYKPTTAGTYNSNLSIVSNDPQYPTKTIKMTGTAAESLSISDTALPVSTYAYVNTAFANNTLTVTDNAGGSGPYNWSLSGAPSGLSIATPGPTTTISGSPAATGTYNYTVSVSGTPAFAQKSFSVTVYPEFKYTTTTLATGTQNSAYSDTVVVTGGNNASYTYSIAMGSLPAGLTIDTGTGVISGTPTGTGTSNFTARVTDANGYFIDQALSITVNAPPAALVITTASLPDALVGEPYSTTLAATGGVTPRKWSATNLPASFTLYSSTGEITGTPASGEQGAYSVSITVTDSAAATATTTLSLNVNIITVTISTAGFKNTADIISDYSYQFTATTSPNADTSYAWSVSSGSLPAGLSLDANTGLLSGKATTTGTYTFKVKAVGDPSTASGETANLTIEVVPDLAYVSSAESFKCFIATAAYGSYLDPHVATLRAFRDKYLLTNAPGRLFVELYYRYSPPFAAFIARHDSLRFAVRLGLTPVVYVIEHTAFVAFLLLSAILWLPVRRRTGT